jgi:hypothetical protein
VIKVIVGGTVIILAVALLYSFLMGWGIVAGIALDRLGLHHPTWIYEIPQDFHGWARIETQNPSCSPIPLAGRNRVVRLSPDGTFCTSSKDETAIAEYYFTGINRVQVPVSAPGGNGLIWGASSSFFVGTYDEYMQELKRKGTRFRH